jgi:type II secretory pathway component PulF
VFKRFMRRHFFFPQRSQFAFLSNFASLRAGDNGKLNLSSKETLAALRDIYEQEAGDDSIELQVCSSMLECIREGDGLHDAMEEWFHPDICLTYRVSQAAGNMQSGVDDIIAMMSNQNKLKSGFIFSMLMPLMIFIVGTAAFLIISTGILPTLFTTPGSLEKATGLVVPAIWLGAALKKIGPFIVIGLPPLLAGFLYLVPRWGLTGIYRNFAAGRFFSLFSLLIRSKLSVRDALQTLLPHVSPFIQGHIEQMLDMTQEGVSEFKQLDTNLLPIQLRIRLLVSGKSGSKSATEVFSTVAKHATRDFSEAIQKAQATLYWSLIAIGMGLLGLAIGAVFSMSANMVNMF